MTMETQRGIFKPWPNALDFSLDIAPHVCRVKCRECFATLYSDVERCRRLSSHI